MNCRKEKEGNGTSVHGLRNVGKIIIVADKQKRMSVWERGETKKKLENSIRIW